MKPAITDRARVRRSVSPWLSRQWARRRSSHERLPAPQIEGYGPELIAEARAAWPMKAAEEYRSASIYAALQSAAMLAGFPLDLVAVAASASLDELGHAALCLDVARALGDPAPVEASMEAVNARVADTPPRWLALKLLLVEVAMGETVSCALFRAGRDEAVEPVVRTALSWILRDEARHARVGWECLSALGDELTSNDRELLQREATLQLGLMEQAQAVPSLRRLEAKAPFDPELALLGVLSPERRVEAFYQAVEGSVCVRLGRLGLDGGRAWADRYRLPR